MKRIHNQTMEQDALTLLLRDLIELKAMEQRSRKWFSRPRATIEFDRGIREQRARIDALIDEIVEYKLQGAIASDAGVYKEWQRLRGKVD